MFHIRMFFSCLFLKAFLRIFFKKLMHFINNFYSFSCTWSTYVNAKFIIYYLSLSAICLCKLLDAYFRCGITEECLWNGFKIQHKNWSWLPMPSFKIQKIIMPGNTGNGRSRLLGKTLFYLLSINIKEESD